VMALSLKAWKLTMSLKPQKITCGLPVVKKWIEANFILFFPQIGYPYIILLTYAIRGEEVVPAAAPLL
jgi:hypothetical protein